VSQEEGSLFWEVTESVILSKNVDMYMCLVPNGFQGRTMDVTACTKECQDALDEQHAMSSDELQSGLMLTKFLKMYNTR
jgi:hypothetical protein